MELRLGRAEKEVLLIIWDWKLKYSKRPDIPSLLSEYMPKERLPRKIDEDIAEEIVSMLLRLRKIPDRDILSTRMREHRRLINTYQKAVKRLEEKGLITTARPLKTTAFKALCKLTEKGRKAVQRILIEDQPMETVKEALKLLAGKGEKEVQAKDIKNALWEVLQKRGVTDQELFHNVWSEEKIGWCMKKLQIEPKLKLIRIFVINLPSINNENITFS